MPVPEYALIMPVDVFILRTLKFPWSAIYKFPAESVAIPVGLFKNAEVEAPPSPVFPVKPPPVVTGAACPAYLVIIPKVSTLRII